jgi:hypothetical protein
MPQNTQASCGESTQTQQPPCRRLRNACDLLTTADIEKVQGEPLQDKTSSGQPGAPMALSQCYFAAPTASKSVTVTVWQQVKQSGKNPPEFWNERFHGEGVEDKDSEEEEEREKLRQKLVPEANLRA